MEHGARVTDVSGKIHYILWGSGRRAQFPVLRQGSRAAAELRFRGVCSIFVFLKAKLLPASRPVDLHVTREVPKGMILQCLSCKYERRPARPRFDASPARS